MANKVKVTDFIGEKLFHEKGTQRVVDSDGKLKFEVNSAKEIKEFLGFNCLNLDMDKVYEFQDKYIQWIVDAINQKLKNEK